MSELKKKLNALKAEMIASIDEKKIEDDLRKMDPNEREKLMKAWGVI